MNETMEMAGPGLFFIILFAAAVLVLMHSQQKKETSPWRKGFGKASDKSRPSR